MTTLLTVPGYRPQWFPISQQQQAMTKLMRGELAALADRIVPVNYRNYLNPGGDADGAVVLSKALPAALETSDYVIVSGHSLGSAAIVLYLKNEGTEGSIDPDRVWFVASGLTMWMQDILEDLATPYRTTVVNRQYDNWCDYPNLKKSPHYHEAILNIGAGMRAPFNIHTSYKDFSLSDPRLLERVQGNVTWCLYPTYPLPFQDGNRDEIETAYNRTHFED